MGDVLLVKSIEDESGKSKTTRPLVLLTRTEEILAADELVGVAVSKRFPHPPRLKDVLLPFSPDGRVCTGLYHRSAAICTWAVAFTADRVVKRKGHVPVSVLQAILEKVRGSL